jgi:hypothetical protein
MLRAMATRRSAKKTAPKNVLARGGPRDKPAANEKASAKAAPKRAAPKVPVAKRAITKKPAAKKPPAKKPAAKKPVAKEAGPPEASAHPNANGSPAADRGLTPVGARPTRTERARRDSRIEEVDAVCAAWADIVAERMAADQTFADLVEQLGHFQARDLRGLFLWDALQAAESHVSLINDVLAAHIQDRRADPLAILADLRDRQLRVAAVYAVNAFLAVLNQMKPQKPKWLSMDDLDPRFAVLALAHQTLGYALEAIGVEAPPDLTEPILGATQDEAVWVWRRMPEPGTDTLAACAAAAAFFRALGAPTMISTDEVAAFYGEHAQQRAMDERDAVSRAAASAQVG